MVAFKPLSFVRTHLFALCLLDPALDNIDGNGVTVALGSPAWLVVVAHIGTKDGLALADLDLLLWLGDTGQRSVNDDSLLDRGVVCASEKAGRADEERAGARAPPVGHAAAVAAG